MKEQWIGKIDGELFTIYQYRDSADYSIGAKDSGVPDKVIAYMEKFLGTSESIKESKTSLVETKKQIKELQIQLAEAKAVNEKAIEFYNTLYTKHQDTSDRYAHDAIDFSGMVDSLTKKCAALEISRESAAETVLIETKKVLESRHTKSVQELTEAHQKEIKEQKDQILKLMEDNRLQVEEMTKLGEQFNESTAVLEGKIEEADKTHKAELESLKEQHHKQIVEKYVDCVLDFSGLQLPSQARALLGECKTEEEADDLIEKFRNAMRESSLHSMDLSDIAVVTEDRATPAEKELTHRVTQVFEGIKGKK